MIYVEIKIGTIPSLKVWIKFAQKSLTEADKDFIMLGEKLTDKHKNFAQALIKKQFDNLSGLYSTWTITQLQAPVVTENVLQILHIGGDHWAVASNSAFTTGEVNLYDSLNSSTTIPMQMLLKEVFGNATITLLKYSKHYDCGVWSFCHCFLHCPNTQYTIKSCYIQPTYHAASLD